MWVGNLVEVTCPLLQRQVSHSGFPLSLTLSHPGERGSRSRYFILSSTKGKGDQEAFGLTPSPHCGRGQGRGDISRGHLLNFPVQTLYLVQGSGHPLLHCNTLAPPVAIVGGFRDYLSISTKERCIFSPLAPRACALKRFCA